MRQYKHECLGDSAKKEGSETHRNLQGFTDDTLTDDESIEGVRSLEFNDELLQQEILNGAIAKNRLDRKPVWMRFREALKKALSDFLLDVKKNKRLMSEDLKKTFFSIQSISEKTLNPALLRLKVKMALRLLRRGHPFYTRLSWRLESQLYWSMTCVLENPEYNQSELYYAYNTMIEGLLKEKMAELKQLSKELDALSLGRSSELVRNYYELQKEAEKLRAHLAQLTFELDESKSQISTLTLSLDSADEIAKAAETTINNLMADNQEHQRSNVLLEKELKKLLDENQVLREALDRERMEKVKLKAEKEELEGKVLEQEETLDHLRVENAQLNMKITWKVMESAEYKALEKSNWVLNREKIEQSSEIEKLNARLAHLEGLRNRQAEQISLLQSVLGAAGLFKQKSVSAGIIEKVKGILEGIKGFVEEDQTENKNTKQIKY